MKQDKGFRPLKLDKSGRLDMRLVHRVGAGEALGIHACPPHLEQALWRLPGESQKQFFFRASRTAVGSGFVLARLIYADEMQPAMARGSSCRGIDTGAKGARNRASGLVSQ